VQGFKALIFIFYLTFKWTCKTSQKIV